MEVSDGSEAKHEKEERAKMDSYVEMLFTSIRSDNYEQKRSQAHEVIACNKSIILDIQGLSLTTQLSFTQFDDHFERLCTS